MADQNVVGIVLKAFDKVTEPLRKINQAIDKTIAPVRKVSTAFQALSKESGLGKVTDALGKVKSAAGNLVTSVADLATKFFFLGAAAVGGLTLIIKSTLDYANKIDDVSKKTGVAVESLQELGYAASVSGSSAEGLFEGISKFSKAMGLARAQSGPLFGLLIRVNPALLYQLKAAKSNEEAFLKMGAAIGKLKNPQAQAALATAAFGRAGADLIPLFKEGPAGLARLRAEVSKFDLTKMEVSVAKLADDTFKKFFFIADQVKNKVIVKLLPALTNLFEKFSGWLDKNADKIEKWGDELADKLPEILDKLVTVLGVLGDVLVMVGAAFEWLGEHPAVLKTLLVALALVITGKVIAAVWALTLAVGELGLAILLTPIGWIIAGLAALVYVSVKVYQHWDDIKGVFNEMVKIMEKAIGFAVDLGKAFLNIPESIMTKFGMTGAATGAGNAISAPNKSESRGQAAVRVSFDNLPKGSRVENVTKDKMLLDLSMGYAMHSGG